jgi:hypothetical protein
MKRRIAVWAGLGFVVACCWLLYVFLTPRDHLNANLSQPAVQALTSVSCPIVLAGRYFNVPLSLWTVAVADALTYAAIRHDRRNAAPNVEAHRSRLVSKRRQTFTLGRRCGRGWGL